MLKTPPFHHHKVTLTTFTTTTFQCINQTAVPQPVFSQSLLQLQPVAIDCWKSRCSKLPGRSQISTSEIHRRNQYHSPGDQNVVPGQKANHWVWMISRPKKIGHQKFQCNYGCGTPATEESSYCWDVGMFPQPSRWDMQRGWKNPHATLKGGHCYLRKMTTDFPKRMVDSTTSYHPMTIWRSILYHQTTATPGSWRWMQHLPPAYQTNDTKEVSAIFQSMLWSSQRSSGVPNGWIYGRIEIVFWWTGSVSMIHFRKNGHWTPQLSERAGFL